MPKFKFEITETLQRIVEVEAEDAEKAFEQVYTQYTENYIVLDAEDFKDFEINEYKE